MDDALLTVANVMMPTTVSGNIRDTVMTAAEIIRRHTLAGLPIVEDGHVIGLVTPQQLLLEPAYRPVTDVMTREIAPATPDLSLLQANALMTRQRVDVLPVVDDGGQIIGQISVAAILRAHGQQTDPLTGLPWSTALRSWASVALLKGREIAILFVDLDNFGAVNKALGHVVGDDILRSVALFLESLVDSTTDLLCRYGGDEFAIATTREQNEAHALAERIMDTVSLPIEIGVATRRITVSVGFSGGRRVEGRKPSHIAATVDDLLTLASHASTALKQAKAAAEATTGDVPAQEIARITEPEGAGQVLQAQVSPGVTPSETRLHLVEVVVQTGPRGCTAAVTLKLRAHEHIGHATRPLHGRGVMLVVAEATLEAIRHVIGEQHTYVLEELTEVPTEIGKLVMAVLTNGQSERSRKFVGGAWATDLGHAVAKAILDALNRWLAKTIAEELQAEPSSTGLPDEY